MSNRTALDQTKARNQLARDPGRPMPCKYCGEMPEEHGRVAVALTCANAQMTAAMGSMREALARNRHANPDGTPYTLPENSIHIEPRGSVGGSGK